MKKTAFNLALGMLFLGACSSDQPDGPEICPVGPPTGNAEFVKANNLPADWKYTTSIDWTKEDYSMLEGFQSFGYNLAKAAADKSSNGEFCVSPVSVSLYLGMIANASSGSTHTQILNALGTDDISALNPVCRKLMHYLPCEDYGSCLTINNNFWVSNLYDVPQAFEQLMGDVFYAGVSHVDFANEATVPAINRWVWENTNGLIPSLLDGDWKSYISTPMVSANTVYFKGNWKLSFNPADTKAEKFYGLKSTKKVDTMHRKIETAYCSDGRVEKIILSFEDPINEMELYLPAKGKNVKDILDVLSVEGRKQLNTKYETCLVNLSLPKFSSQTETGLNGILHNMGITALGNIDFSPMGLGTLPLEVLHKTSVKIDEDGAEMAALTGGWCGSSGIEPPKPREITLEFNRPFLYVIRNSRTGAIMMAGTVSDF